MYHQALTATDLKKTQVIEISESIFAPSDTPLVKRHSRIQMSDIEGHLTVCYKETPEGLPIYFDIWPPIPEKSTTSERSSGTVPSVSVVLYFHGGGLTAGNRRSWFPLWLQSRFRPFVCDAYGAGTDMRWLVF